ncbi:hypothetical protein F5Y11DRAFT_173086 [Daldinia sp. FL1419]|nr:hypothetical protein F5Y11DRAFT_173086 [Daldinia sp. FL1419]
MSKSRPCDTTTTFIINTPSKRSIGEDRKIIRSHVMRGKNRKRLPSRPTSWINSTQLKHSDGVNTRNSTPVPPKVGGELSFIRFPGEIDSAVFGNIWKLKDGMHPLELNLAPGRTDGSWLEPICSDAACFHFTIFVAMIYGDSMRGRDGTNKTALAHFIKALGLLQERIASLEYGLLTSDSTILVVVGLAMTSTATGDLEVALRHMKGLHQIVALRGGISAFRMDKQLQLKILRADLGVALTTGHKPLFFSEDIPWGSYISRCEREVYFEDLELSKNTALADIRHFINGLDTRLRHIWDDICQVVRAANIAIQCRLSLDIEIYQETMVSIHYRLLGLYFNANDVNEAIRLILLMFASSFFLQWRGAKTNYVYLSRHLKEVLLAHSTNSIPAGLLVWIYVVYTILDCNRDNQVWLQRSLAQVLQVANLKSWNDTRSILNSIVWLGKLHDFSAKRTVEESLLANVGIGAVGR